jgi:hypothetical protein
MLAKNYVVKNGLKGTGMNLIIHKLEFWAQFVHNILVFQIPIFDALLGGCNQPIMLGLKHIH